jgi:ABC-type uncharacterized transport system substrate-binding protein
MRISNTHTKTTSFPCTWGEALLASACYFLLAALLIIYPFDELQAEENQLLIVTNNQRPLHHLFITQLKHELATLNRSIQSIDVVDSKEWRVQDSNNHKLTLVLGSQAAIQLSQQKTSSPVIYSLIPRPTYQELMQSNKNCTPGNCTAVYIDQPVERILKLTRIALPKLKTAGILTSSKSNLNISHLKSLARSEGIEIQHKQTENTKNLIFDLSDVLRHSDALLSIPDRGIYSRYTVQSILLTAYRHRKPVIGYSRSFVKAGALFAVYSTPAQLSMQTSEIISQFFNTKNHVLPAPQHPRYFSVSVNEMVANSLGIQIESEAVLQEKLEAVSHE